MGKVLRNSRLLIMYVSISCTNIPHEEGIKALENTLMKITMKAYITAKAIKVIMMLILTLNNCKYNNNFI